MRQFFTNIYKFPFQFNVSHEIRHLSFGTDYPGIINPLDETAEYAQARKLWNILLFACMHVLRIRHEFWHDRITLNIFQMLLADVCTLNFAEGIFLVLTVK